MSDEIKEIEEREWEMKLKKCEREIDEYIEKECEDSKKIGDFTQWQLLPNNEFIASPLTTITLPAGMYSVYWNNGRPIFCQKEIKTDEFIVNADSKLYKILEDINDFWNKKEIFKEYGFLHRRGILLTGPAGCGKSVLIQQIARNLVDKNNGIILFVDNATHILNSAINELRKVEKDRKLICIFEDIDAYIQNYGEEATLAFLDGENLTDNILNIATTNYPDRLDARITQRPRRFDRVIEILMPEPEMRELYFKKKLKIEGEELKKFVELTYNFSFAAMTELVISVKCFNMDVNEAIEILTEQRTKKPKSNDDYYKSKAGF